MIISLSKKLSRYVSACIYVTIFLSCSSKIQKEKHVLQAENKNFTENNLKTAKNLTTNPLESSTKSISLAELEKTITNLKIEKVLVPVGLMTKMFYEEKKIHEAFRCFEKINIKTGRELITFVLDSIAQTYNENKAIQEYLSYPSFLQNIEIEIFIEKGNELCSSLPEKNELAIITYKNGKITYETCDPASMKLHIIHEESFVESALALPKKLKNITIHK